MTRLLWYLPFVAALLVPAAFHAQQTSSTPDGVISGVVIDGSTSAPVPDAVVFITATPARPLGSQTRQLTDERGRFVFVNLPGDVSYSLSVGKPGYLEGGYGRDATPADPLRQIPLKADEWIAHIKVPIWKPSSIAGAVRDESGEPVVGVVVRALQRVRIQGRDEFLAGPVTRTDDRGFYRLANLSPGKYVVQAPSVQAAVPMSMPLLNPTSPPRALVGELPDVMDVDNAQRLVVGRYAIPPPPRNGRQMSYPGVFHPSALSIAEAETINLKFGDDRQRVDLALMPVVSVRVSGLVEGPAQALQSLTLRLLPAGLENLGFGSEAATALVAADGTFTFLNVPAGSYVLDAPVWVNEMSSVPAQIGAQRPMQGPPTSPVMGASGSKTDLFPTVMLTRYNFRSVSTPHAARMPVTVGNADVTGVRVVMRPFGTMTGRLVIEPDPSGAGAEVPDRFAFQLDPARGEVALVSAGRGGRGGAAVPNELSIGGFQPGLYWIRLDGLSGWIVKSVSWSGKDYTNAPIDTSAIDSITDVVITVTNAVAGIAGTVRDSADLKADTTMVIVFPADPAAWKNTGLWPARMKASAVSSTGAFRVGNLPAGEYLVAAIARSFTDTWRESEFLTAASRSASRVTLAWGTTSTVQLNAAVIR